MNKKTIDHNQSAAAKVAGIAIVIMGIAAVVANDLTIVKLFVPENASETTKNILESGMLFRAGVFSWLVILICDTLAAWGLYIFFKPVNKNLSLIMAWFRLIYVSILGASLANLINVITLINNTNYLTLLGTEYLQSQILFYTTAFFDTWSLGLIIFGIHILILGWLILKSGFNIKILGILLIIAFVGYTIINGSNLLFPQYEETMVFVGWAFFIPMISEVALGIWLLFIGIKRVKQIN